MVQEESHDVVVVGAGFCGIATAAALRRYGVEDIVLLEAGNRYGAFWAHTYERLSLHSPWHGLPDDRGLNDDFPMFKSRLELMDYFRRYATLHRLDEIARFGDALVELRRAVGRTSAGWHVETTRGRHRARFVVIATGYCRQPRLPSIRGLEHFEPPLLHSAEYVNGHAWRGRNILVVGSGNSAFEIALDLVEHGASSVTMLVHGPRYVIPIESFGAAMEQARATGAYGVDAITNAHRCSPETAEYRGYVQGFDELLRSLAVDLSPHGIHTPSRGPWDAALHAGRNSVFDHGTADLIRNGTVCVINDRIDHFRAERVVLAEHGSLRFDGIIMATGFGAGLEPFLRDPSVARSNVLRADDPRGSNFPVTDGRCRALAVPNLYFVGYDMSPWGGMAHGHWGFEVGEKIASALGTFSAAQRPPELRTASWAA
ncbi:MAG: NAD(P)/FAD-dependent oxidoreductase [Gammaproteobacteria bacterium]